MDIEPNEIFTTGAMPKTYQELARLDVPLKLIAQFPLHLKSIDIVELHRVEKLSSEERSEGVKRVITAISTRSNSSPDSNSPAERRIRL